MSPWVLWVPVIGSGSWCSSPMLPDGPLIPPAGIFDVSFPFTLFAHLLSFV